MGGCLQKHAVVWECLQAPTPIQRILREGYVRDPVQEDAPSISFTYDFPRFATAGTTGADTETLHEAGDRKSTFTTGPGFLQPTLHGAQSYGRMSPGYTVKPLYLASLLI